VLLLQRIESGRQGVVSVKLLLSVDGWWWMERKTHARGDQLARVSVPILIVSRALMDPISDYASEFRVVLELD